MPASEAQKRANAKYRREKMKSMTLAFYPADLDLWEHLSGQPNKQAYVRNLIREDMERQKA